MPVASLVVRIAADIADFEKNIAGVERTLLRTGRNLESIGSRMTKGITLPLVAAVGVAAKAAIDFESSFAGVRKTVEATDEQFKELEGQFRNLAKTMPLSVNEINKVAESAGQLGVKIGDISAFTQTMIKMGTATNLTADEAATAMARFANALGQPRINMEQLGSAIVKLGQEGASTEKEIIDMSLRMAGAGAQIGLSAGSVLGMANALSSVGIEADKGGSAISRLFNDLNSAVSQGGNTLRDFAAVAGLTAEAFGKLFKEDSASAITKFIEGLHAQKAAGTDLLKVLDDLGISELRYRDTVLLAANAGPEFAKSIRTGNTAFAEGKALQDEYNERLKTTESQLKILKGNLTDVAVTFGQAFLPILQELVVVSKPFVESLAGMAREFGKLPEPIRNITFGMLALLASLGPIIFVVGKVQQAFAGILGVVRFFIPAMETTGTSVTGLGVRFTGLLGTLGRFAGPVALVTSGLFAVKQAMDAFHRSTEEGLKVLGSAVPAIGLVTRAVDTLKSSFPALGGIFDDVATIIKNSLIIAFERLKDAFGIVKDSLLRTAEVIRDSLKPLFDALGVDMDRLAKMMRNTVIPAVAATALAFIQAIPGVRGLLELIAILPGFDKVAAALDRVAASTGKTVDELRGFKPIVAGVDGAFKDGKFSIDAWRNSLLKTDDGFTVAKEGMITFGSGVNTHVVKPLKLGGEEIDKAKSKLRELADSFSGAGLIKAMQDTVAAVGLSGVAIVDMATDQQRKISETIGAGIDQLRRLGKEAPEAATAMKNAADAALSSWRNVPTLIGFSVNEIERFIEASKRMLTPLSKTEIPEVNLGIRGFMDEMDAQVRDRLPKAIRDSLTLDEVNLGIRGFMDEMDQQIRDRAGSTVNPFREAFTNFGQDLPNIIFGALQGGGSVVGAVAAGLAAEFSRVFAARVAESIKNDTPLSGSSKAMGLAGLGLSSFIGGFGAGEELGKGKGALAGAAAGAVGGIPLAAFTGGLSILVGGIAGAIGGWLGGMKKAKEQLAELREAQLSVLQEFGGFDKLKAKADEFGISLGNALTTKKPEEFTRVMERLGKAIDEQKTRIEGFGIAVEGINAKAALFAAPFEALLKDTSVDGFTAKLAEMGQRGQAEFERIGTFAAAAFAGMVKESGNAIGAINALAPTLTILQKGLDEFGLTSTGTINSLLGMFSFINDKVSGPIFANIQATGQIFEGLTKGGLVTKELFQTVGTDIGASFRELEAKGGDVSKAMALSQPILQRLWEGQQLYGDITDDTTKSILKQAEEQGLVGANMKSVNDKILDVLIEIRDIFGKDLPKAFQATKDAAAETARRIEQDFERIKIRIPIEYVDTGFDPTASGKFATPLASGGIVRRPTFAFLGEDGPEAVIPLNQLGSVAPQEGTSTVIFEIAGQRIARATVPYLPGEIRRYVPA